MHRLTDQLFSIDVGGKEIMLKEYCFGTNCKQGFYLIDSNILIAMGNLYYKGKCKSEELKNEIIDFILTTRRYGVQNQFALVELCYDYNTNQINTEAMQKIMIAYDNLLTSMSDDEIVNHKGAGDFCISNKDKQQKNYKSIYDCNLPLYMFGETGKELKITFLVMYLYMLKIYQLYFNHNVDSFDKIKLLFEFMTKEVDVLLANEFLMATLLFIGNNNEKNIAKRVFKPKEKPELMHVLNATIDVFQYRMASAFAEMFAQMGNPIFIKFVTADKPLQDFMDHVNTYNTVISKDMITSLNIYNMDVAEKYREKWADYSNNVMNPIMKDRYFQLHLGGSKLSLDFEEKVKKNIILLEQEILCKNEI